MEQQIRIALIGAGFAGQAHAFGYRNALMADSLQGVDVQLAAVVDPQAQLAAQVARKYGFARATTSVDDVLKDPHIDAVSVALPNFAAADVISRALAAGKHVFAEKPLGTSADEAVRLAATAIETHRVAAVGFSFRRIPALAALRQAVAAGDIGRPYFARAFYYADYAVSPESPLTWRFVQDTSGGGALIDIGAHAIDALTHVLGPIHEVSGATLHTAITERPLPAGGIGHAARPSKTERGAVTTDDIALLNVRFTDGAVGSLQLSRVAAGTPNQLGIEVYGSTGHVTFDSSRFDEYAAYDGAAGPSGHDGPRRIIAGPAFPYYNDVSPMRARGTGTGYGEAFAAEIQEFLAAVAGVGDVTSSFEAAVHPMHVIQAALRSAAQQAPAVVEGTKSMR